MAEEAVKYTHGEPISLTPPVVDSSLVEQGLKAFADQSVIDTYRRDSGLNPNDIASSDLQRAVQMARLGEKDETKKLNSMNADIASYDEKIKNRNPLEHLYDLTFGRDFSPEARKAKREDSKKSFVAEVTEQKARIGELMDTISNDPSLVEMAVEQAYQQAQIIQRIALGVAIRQVNGGRVPDAKSIEQFAKLYNDGKVGISKSALESATITYDRLIETSRKMYFRKDGDVVGQLTNPFDTKSLVQDQIIRDTFDPIKQAQS